MSTETGWQLIHKTAGFIAAHAMWQLHDDDVVVPLLAYSSNGNRCIEEIISENMAELESKIEKAKIAVSRNVMDAEYAILIYPASVDLSNQARTCVLLEMSAYASNQHSWARLVVPYSVSKNFFGGKKLVIHPPGLLDGDADFDVPLAMQAFFEGLEEHSEGASIWSKCFEQSPI